ncbi:MAG TPA: HD domain-containing protein [Polyangiaceae bacterium]|nr:HD domain-containing protein [Polyangiaceae bacterium]
MSTPRPESIRELREVIRSDAALVELHEIARASGADDPAHDVAHAERVALWTLRLAPHVAARIAIAAALLHDAVNLPKDSPDRARASEFGAAMAARILPGLGFSGADTASIADAIRTHSFSRGETPNSELGRALQDADRLETLGALGLCRVLSTGARLGARYFDALDPWAEARDLDDRSYSVDHFFTKLLGLCDTMLTQDGRREARVRTEVLIRFLEQLGREIGVSLPQPRRST